AMASALTERPSGFRNSPASTSPGWVVTRLGVATPFVIVDDFDIGGTLLGPGEADAPLIGARVRYGNVRRAPEWSGRAWPSVAAATPHRGANVQPRILHLCNSPLDEIRRNSFDISE